MGLESSNSEADLAMNSIKGEIILEENIYELSLDNLPPDDHADPHGKIMVHAPRTGWCCIHISNVKEHIEEHFCNYYTFTPPQPPPKSYNEYESITKDDKIISGMFEDLPEFPSIRKIKPVYYHPEEKS